MKKMLLFYAIGKYKKVESREQRAERRKFFNLSTYHVLRGISCILIYTFILIGCATSEYDISTHSEELFLYSTEKEVAIGQNIAKKIAAEFKISSNPSLIERVNNIGDKIAKVCDRQEINYYFYIIEEDEKNAFSIPGGYVYIYKGLLDILKSDDELAFVLAHEVSHIVARHSIKRLQASLGYNLLILVSGAVPSDPQFSQGLSFALAQLLAAYSREDEFKSDELAAKYLQMTSFDPKAGIDVMEKLYKESKKEIKPISYFRTHPHTAQRIRNIKEKMHIPLSAEDYLNF